MALQPTPMLRSSTVEMDSESNDRALTRLTSHESTALNTSEDRPSEKKEDEEETVASPVAPAPGPGDFPDGGFAAWCVVVGVSRLNHFPRLFEFFLMPCPVVCRLHALCSRRRLHSTSLVLNTRLTFLSFGLVNAWGVRAFHTLPLVDVTAHL